MLRLLLVGQTQDYYEFLLPTLESRYDVRICCSGNAFLPELLAFRPELTVIDTAVPGCDFPGLLRLVRAMNICPKVLALAYSSAEVFPDSLITFLLIKPFCRDDLLLRIEDMEKLLRKDRQDRLWELAGSILQELGLKPSRTGFRCLQHAALYLCANPACLFIDELYPYIAKLCDGSVKSVEKAMARCIEDAWSKRNDFVWQHYFGPMDRCPTNVRFLKTLTKSIADEF